MKRSEFSSVEITTTSKKKKKKSAKLLNKNYWIKLDKLSNKTIKLKSF